MNFAVMEDLRQTLSEIYTPQQQVLEVCAEVKVMKIQVSDVQQTACTQNKNYCVYTNAEILHIVVCCYKNA